VLTPLDGNARSGRWRSSPQSAVGNRTTDPLRMTVWVDNVAPIITTTAAISTEIVGERRTVLQGMVTDGGPTTNVWATIETPSGDRYRQQAARDGSNWWFDLNPLSAGRYRLWVVAGDLAGNSTTSGPYTVMVNNPYSVNLPIVMQNFAILPDLVVDRLVATSDAVTVTIRNAGNGPVEDAFWVDVYFNPTEYPSVNEPWHTIAAAVQCGGVTTPIAAGGVLTLTVGDAYYFPQYSGPTPYPVGANVYAQVDSVDFSTSYGAVQESDETNNVLGPVESVGGGGEALSQAGNSAIPPVEGLPKRER